MIAYLIARLTEPSTWRGVVTLLTGLGVALSPDQAAAIIALGMAIHGVLAAFTPDRLGNSGGKIAAIALVGLCLAPLPAHAQYALPFRNNHENRLKALEQKLQQQQAVPAPQAQPIVINVPTPQPAPQPNPQIIYQPYPAQPPLQTFPLQGQPLQTFPIQGQPLQPFPIQGQPLQTYPIQGSPQQGLPIQGPPKQSFPLAPPPPQGQQQIPPQPGVPPPVPPASPSPDGQPKQHFPVAPPTTPPAPNPAPSNGPVPYARTWTNALYRPQEHK